MNILQLYLILTASAMKDEADTLASKYDNSSSLYLNVAKHGDNLNKAIQEHDLAIR